MTAKRVAFVQVVEQHDYVDARFDVLLKVKGWTYYAARQAVTGRDF